MTIDAAPDVAAPVAAPPHSRALAWVRATDVAQATTPGGFSLGAAPYTLVASEPDLLVDAPRRSLWRPGVVLPAALVCALASAYAATTLLWPLHAVPPVVEAMTVQPVAAPAFAAPWPAEGSASVSVAGMGAPLSSTAAAAPIASITKVVTALLVLEEMPLAVGDPGPDYRFTRADMTAYWQYRSDDESALEVPVGGVLTEYQLLEGMLIGSANNYADRLAAGIWPSDAVFAKAANDWLRLHGVPGVTIADPTGIDPRNTASPESLIPLARLAMAHPVIAEIVAKSSTELPGAGLVPNTNGLLADPGVIGIKTGSLEEDWGLLSAKNVLIGETPVRLYASVLSQPDDEARLAASRALYSALEASLQPFPSVPSGTVVGSVTTVWGSDVDIQTTADAGVVLWNGGVGTTTTDFSLGDAREEGDEVGTLSVSGPLDSDSTALALVDDIEGPTAWWRLTHPLDLFGID
ncbi:MAG TPA: D-alanyl-D-alanine carboxypeptidase [Microbacterium sp.]|uniref:D-alanyl-D-alanine carboxypeptidase family protein n=1 Tax=Microbacterium sp. TaxID=51671 RepID=UPI002C4B6F82|nr:D-alanyl-D-alanine carboxypeptidase [Microbacterium sp.]HWI31239.1 D-alanyl-D-alanine carboxypeptidase [Microbacterium sp.]